MVSSSAAACLALLLTAAALPRASAGREGLLSKDVGSADGTPIISAAPGDSVGGPYDGGRSDGDLDDEWAQEEDEALKKMDAQDKRRRETIAEMQKARESGDPHLVEQALLAARRAGVNRAIIDAQALLSKEASKTKGRASPAQRKRDAWVRLEEARSSGDLLRLQQEIEIAKSEGLLSADEMRPAKITLAKMKESRKVELSKERGNMKGVASPVKSKRNAWRRPLAVRSRGDFEKLRQEIARRQEQATDRLDVAVQSGDLHRLQSEMSKAQEEGLVSPSDFEAAVEALERMKQERQRALMTAALGSQPPLRSGKERQHKERVSKSGVGSKPEEAIEKTSEPEEADEKKTELKVTERKEQDSGFSEKEPIAEAPPEQTGGGRDPKKPSAVKARIARIELIEASVALRSSFSDEAVEKLRRAIGEAIRLGIYDGALEEAKELLEDSLNPKRRVTSERRFQSPPISAMSLLETKLGSSTASSAATAKAMVNSRGHQQVRD